MKGTKLSRETHKANSIITGHEFGMERIAITTGIGLTRYSPVPVTAKTGVPSDCSEFYILSFSKRGQIEAPKFVLKPLTFW